MRGSRERQSGGGADSTARQSSGSIFLYGASVSCSTAKFGRALGIWLPVGFLQTASNRAGLWSGAARFLAGCGRSADVGRLRGRIATAAEVGGAHAGLGQFEADRVCCVAVAGERRCDGADLLIAGRHEERGGASVALHADDVEVLLGVGEDSFPVRLYRSAGVELGDRKSTRLNYSHVSISYLCPYTTLFRSQFEADRVCCVAVAGERRCDGADLLIAGRHEERGGASVALHADDVEVLLGVGEDSFPVRLYRSAGVEL